MREMYEILPGESSENNKISLCKIRNLQTEILHFENSFQKQFGFSLNEGMVLCILSSEKELTCGALGEKLSLTPSNTSKILSHLERQEYITRKLGKEDRRHMLFSITDKGRKKLLQINSECEIPAELKDSIQI